MKSPVDGHETVAIKGIDFSHKDVFEVVDTFYYRVQQHPQLKVPFQSVHDWEEHIQRLTHFWWIKFGGNPYLLTSYNPVLKHFQAGFNEELLTHWLTLFHQVIDEKLTPEQANLWKLISSRMGEALSIRNEMYREAQNP